MKHVAVFIDAKDVIIVSQMSGSKACPRGCSSVARIFGTRVSAPTPDTGAVTTTIVLGIAIASAAHVSHGGAALNPGTILDTVILSVVIAGTAHVLGRNAAPNASAVPHAVIGWIRVVCTTGVCDGTRDTIAIFDRHAAGAFAILASLSVECSLPV